MAEPAYRYQHEQARKRLLSTCPPCFHCGEPNATIADHDPPLSSVPPGQAWQGVLRPSCLACSLRQGGQLSTHKRRAVKGVPAPSRPW